MFRIICIVWVIIILIGSSFNYLFWVRFPDTQDPKNEKINNEKEKKVKDFINNG